MLARAAVAGPLEVALAIAGVAIAILYGGWVVPAMLIGGVVTWAAWRAIGSVKLPSPQNRSSTASPGCGASPPTPPPRNGSAGGTAATTGW